ncbi:MAG: hypothetical protein OEV21_05820 [Thermoplasmata archaeon]|nr:hypothetical protein [Thermoplasmata archaeon]
MIPIPKSQTHSLIELGRTESARESMMIPIDHLLDDDWERDPYVCHHCETKLVSAEI